MGSLSSAFEVLSKGIIISSNSRKYQDIALFLLEEENFHQLEEIVEKLGFKLIGRSGYFYLSKLNSSREEVERFVKNHKRTIIAIAILKNIYPLLSAGMVVKQTDFTTQLRKREDEELERKLLLLTSQKDLKSGIEEFFKILEKNFVLEKNFSSDRDSFKVLSSINYYLTLVELASQ